MTFLIEPYSAHQKPPKKKHWMEIAEEEALHHRMMMETEARNQLLQHVLHEQAIQEHLALREAAAKQNQTSLNNQNITLPQYTPQPASQQVQDGQFASPSGGGAGYEAMMANISSSEAAEIASFTYTPSSGVGPLIVFFTNTTPTPENDTFFWQFGSGSLTSTLASPGSRNYTQTGSYTVSLQSTSSTGDKSSVSHGITVIAPTLNALESLGDVSGVEPFDANVTGSHTYNGSGTVTGQWDWGDGSPAEPYVSGAGISHTYSTGEWTASLAVTESSYRITNVATFYISASA